MSGIDPNIAIPHGQREDGVQDSVHMVNRVGTKTAIQKQGQIELLHVAVLDVADVFQPQSVLDIAAIHIKIASAKRASTPASSPCSSQRNRSGSSSGQQMS